LFVEFSRLLIVAESLSNLTFACEHPGSKSESARVRQQDFHYRDLLFGSRCITLGLIVAKNQTRANFEIGIRPSLQNFNCLFSGTSARLGICSDGEIGALDQHLCGMQLRRRKRRCVPKSEPQGQRQ
jgi:hypothetical protein